MYQKSEACIFGGRVFFDGFGAGNRRLVKRAAKSQQVLGLYQKFACFLKSRDSGAMSILFSTSLNHALKIRRNPAKERKRQKSQQVLSKYQK